MATTTKVVKFITKYKNHQLVMVPTRRVVEDGMSYQKAGKTIKFNGYEYETSNKEEIDFIKGHRLFGSVIFEDKAGA
ncbi:MAG: hypothetical protein PWP31_1814 [Clostridia bacterium]|jgi:hypothetical protein|nr:hypothetical protein [Clostridia bacterium]